MLSTVGWVMPCTEHTCACESSGDSHAWTFWWGQTCMYIASSIGWLTSLAAIILPVGKYSISARVYADWLTGGTEVSLCWLWTKVLWENPDSKAVVRYSSRLVLCLALYIGVRYKTLSWQSFYQTHYTLRKKRDHFHWVWCIIYKHTNVHVFDSYTCTCM